MATRDYSDDDDFYDQGFDKKGVVSVWVGLGGRTGIPDLDILQDLCGVGYYRLSDQESFNHGFQLVELRELLATASYAESFVDAALAAASKRGLEQARWVTLQYDFAYDPTKVQRPIADDPIFIGTIPYVDPCFKEPFIESFVERRPDGKEIPEGTDLVKLVMESGWEPQKITHIRWRYDNECFALDFPNGVLAKVLPGRRHIALIENVVDAGKPQKRLAVVDAEGYLDYSVSSSLSINGVQGIGEFVWFEPAVTDADDRFGVVFQTIGPGGTEQFQCDIDVETGEIAGIYAAR